MDHLTDLIRLPKVELHEHLDGSLRPSTILDLARSGGVRLPADDPAALARILSPGPSSLEVYLGAFAVTTSVMQTAAALERIAFETVEDWHADGIVYGEVRFAPELHTAGGLAMEAVVEAVLKGLDRGRQAFGVEPGLILCSMRHRPPTLATARLVEAYRRDGVVAFDLAGAEAPFPPEAHRAAFEYCAERFLAATCHAGEAAGPASVRQALAACRALRIGHGVRIAEEWTSDEVPGPGTVSRWIHDRRIPLEVCLTSNLQTRAAASLADHPFGRLRKAGICVTLNTDNRLVSATTLSKELALAAGAWGLDLAALEALQVRSLEAAFAPQETKDRLRAKYFPDFADKEPV